MANASYLEHILTLLQIRRKKLNFPPVVEKGESHDQTVHKRQNK